MNIDRLFSEINTSFNNIKETKGDDLLIETAKDNVLNKLDVCIAMIRDNYQGGNLKNLKELKDQIEMLSEKWENDEIISLFQSVFADKKLLLEEKINTISSELAQDIFTLEEKEGAYLDDHRILKGAPGDQKINSFFLQWFISQAVSYEQSRKLNPDMKQKLDQVILQAYRKSAGFAEAKFLKAQTTPLFSGQTGYFRHDQFAIVEACTNAFASDMQVKDFAEIHLIDSALLREVFNREMSQPHLDLDIDHISKFEALIDHLLQNFKGGISFTSSISKENPVLVDLSKLIAERNLKPSEVETLMQELEDLVQGKIYEFSQKNFSNPAGIRQYLLPKIQCIAFLKHHDINVLLLPHFFKKSVACEEIEEMIGRTGFKLNPAQTVEAWLKVSNIEDILKQEKIPLAALGTKGEIIPKVFSSWNEFLAHPLIEKLQSLSKEKDAPQYQTVLASTTVNLLKGLADCNVGKAYDDKEIGDLLQISYYRMLNAMGEAILRKEKFFEFYSQIELIHQEIQTILTLITPYNDKALEDVVVKNLNNKSLLPTGLDMPKVHLKASAMHSMASVIASVEAQKGASLNVAMQKDSYYESSRLIEKASKYNVSVLDGDLFRANSELAFSKKPEQPIDLFVCEFHHNMSVTKQAYYPEQIKHQVKTMHREGLLANPCTIAVDTTISLDDSDEIRDFLGDEEIQQMIRGGELNIVLLHSAQKFDMLGFDNYYGGISVSINNQSSFEGFNARMDNVEDQLRGFNYQGLTHLQKYGNIDIYKQALIDNTRKLYAMLPEEAIFPASAGSPMQISRSEDELQVFIDVKFPDFPLTGFKVNRKLCEFANEHKLSFTKRASFGFSNTNLSTFNNDMFRLNPGLDDDKSLALYASFFKSIHNAIADKQKEIAHLSHEEQDVEIAKMIANLKIA